MSSAVARGSDHQGSKGFGLLEVVISAGILATVVSASVGLMNQSLKRAVLASERSTAMNLASEALEQVRMVRDSTYIDGQVNSWSDWTRTAALVPCASPQDLAECTSYRVALDGAQLVGGTDGVETITLDNRVYTRRIYVTLPETPYANSAGLVGVSDDAVVRKVIVTVTWADGGPGQSVESITYLTDWRSGV